MNPPFHGIASGTYCGDCIHVGGDASPNAVYWSCAARNLVGVRFETKAGELVWTNQPCPEFESKWTREA